MDATLIQFDVALRGAGMALAGLLAALFALSRVRPAGLFGTFFALGVAAYLTCSWPGFAHTREFWRWPIVAGCLVVPALFWMFARALFEDEFEAGAREAGAVLALLALGAVMIGSTGTARVVAGLALRLCGVALVAHAIWVVVQGRAGDLVERRRRFRAPFVILSGLYVATVGIAEIILLDAPASAGLSAFNAFGILALTFASMLYFTGLRAEVLAPTPPAAAATPAAREAPPAADEALLAKLRQLMEHDRIYRTEGLTIGALAARLGTHEYQLRRLINGRLGHRNFAAFLNGYRLAEARSALSDPAQQAVPILTVALDAGFASLGPFNRAFKADTGMTPGDFRRKHLGAVASH